MTDRRSFNVWLLANLNGYIFPGLRWVDTQRQIFEIVWPRVNKDGDMPGGHGALFQDWYAQKTEPKQTLSTYKSRIKALLQKKENYESIVNESTGKDRYGCAWHRYRILIGMNNASAAGSEPVGMNISENEDKEQLQFVLHGAQAPEPMEDVDMNAPTIMASHLGVFSEQDMIVIGRSFIAMNENICGPAHEIKIKTYCCGKEITNDEVQLINSPCNVLCDKYLSHLQGPLGNEYMQKIDFPTSETLCEFLKSRHPKKVKHLDKIYENLDLGIYISYDCDSGKLYIQRNCKCGVYIKTNHCMEIPHKMERSLYPSICVDLSVEVLKMEKDPKCYIPLHKILLGFGQSWDEVYHGKVRLISENVLTMTIEVSFLKNYYEILRKKDADARNDHSSNYSSVPYASSGYGDNRDLDVRLDEVKRMYHVGTNNI